MKVLKFGGSSVGTPARIKSLLEILKSYYTRGDHFTVVFSAFSGVTDSLLDMSSRAAAGDEGWRASFEAFAKRHQDAIAELVGGAEQEKVAAEMERSHASLANMLSGISLVREASPRMMDYVVSFGERSSAFIITAALRQAGIPASFLDARKVIRTNDNFVNAKVDFGTTYPLIKEYYAQHPDIQIVTGFIGSTPEGLTTTLGRGGSDYTAAIIAAGLDAENIEIWTDVDGVLTADPRKVKKAFTIPTMTYAEAMEMSHFGAKVIYPPTLQPALQKRIPLFIKNTFNPGFEGTYITDKRDPSGHAVTGISSINKVAMLTLQGGGMFGVPGIAGRLFSSLAQAGISVILITQGSSEHSITFAIPPEVAKKAKEQVEAEFEYEIEKGMVEPLKVEADLSVIAIIGENMRFRPGIAGRMFQALGKNGVNVVAIAQGSSELNISVVVAHADEAKAMNALHEAFFLSDTKELHVFMVGVGLIGATLIEQIREQAAFLKGKRSLEIKIVGLANSKTMLFDENGVNLGNWKDLLAASGEKLSLASFVERMKGLNLSNSIFVDNTASEEVPRFYETILESSISISTPNQIATSSSYAQYQRLKSIAARRGVPFLYETNVGAGLPVIGTLEDLITSGDRILKIEGVLSGTMSFIFNKFKAGGQSFSAIVRELEKYLPFDGGDGDILYWHIDSNAGDTLFVNEIGSNQWRPGPKTHVPNLFLAGDYCRTFIDVVTVEGAVVSGLQAALELQHQALADGRVHAGEPLANLIPIARPEAYPDAAMMAMKLALAPYAAAAKWWAWSDAEGRRLGAAPSPAGLVDAAIAPWSLAAEAWRAGWSMYKEIMR